MAISVQFGGVDDARQMRDEHSHALSERDDRRSKTVRFEEGQLADHELDQVTAVAESGRAGRETTGQAPLTDAERREIDFAEARASVPHARSVKGIMLAEGVDDWMAFYDPTLTVDEHREVAERAARDEQGRRMDTGEESPREGLERALSDRCDHARGHCKHGDPDACEFLGEACGFGEEEIAALMEPEADEPEGMAFSGPQLGALRRAWDGYQGALRELDAALEDVRTAEQNARDAFEAVNALRAEAGQDALEPERLDEIRDMDLSEVCESTTGQVDRAVRGGVVETTSQSERVSTS